MFKKLLFGSQFKRNIVTLMTGTSIAQIIPVAISPILTRIYTPEDFGAFALYLALVAIIVIVVTGRYDMAVMLPKKEKNAEHLVRLVVGLSLLCSILLLIFIVIFNSSIVELLDNPNIKYLLYVLPLSTFIVATYSALTVWLNRKRQFQMMAKNRILQNGAISFFQVIGGMIIPSTITMAFSDLLGKILTTLILIKEFISKSTTRKPNILKSIAVAKRYKKFPLFEMPASLFNVAAFQSAFLLIPFVFGSALSGLYFLVFRVIMLPISLVSQAVLEVFKPRATNDFNFDGSCKKIFIKTMIGLFAMGIPGALLIIFFGPYLFAFVFGEEWRVAGEYAQILAPFALFRFVSSPLSYVIVMREKLKIDAAFQFFYFVLNILAIAIGGYYQDIMLLFILLSIAGSLFYSAQLLLSYKLSESPK